MSKAESPPLIHATHLLATVANQPLSMEDRKQKAIELATYLLQETHLSLTKQEKKKQKVLYRMAKVPLGKVFTVTFIDQAFRSHSYKRIADQLLHLLDLFGVPSFFQ